MKVTKQEIQFLKQHILTDISYGSGGTFHIAIDDGLDQVPDCKSMAKAKKILNKLQLLIQI